MTGSTNRPTPAIPHDDSLAQVGSWTVHRAPRNGQSAPPGMPPSPPAGRLPPQAVAPPMVVPLSPQPMGTAVPTRAARRSRSADVALVLGAFVATAGLAFAVGRWSADDSLSSARLAASVQLPEGVQRAEGVRFPTDMQLPAVAGIASAVQPAVETTAPAADEGSAAAGALPTLGERPATDAAISVVGERPATDGAITVVDNASTAAGADTTVERPAFQPPAVNSGDDPSTGLPALGDRQGPPGAMAGFGPGGLQGTVSAVEDGALTIESEGGSLVTVATDTSTTYVRETIADAAEVTVGDLVRVQTPFGGFRGQGVAAGDAPQVAEQVTLLPDPGG